MAPKVLFVLTSHSKLGNTGKPTGWYLPEFAHPYAVLSDQTTIVVASPAGGEAPLDPSSIEASKEDKTSVAFLKKDHLWKNTEKLSTFLGRAKEFDAILYVGGHGPMFDLATDPTSIELIQEFYAHQRIIAAVCHGPAALVNVTIPANSAQKTETSEHHLLSGATVTGFSNAEEVASGMVEAMPFSLEDAIVKAGGKFVKAAEPWGAKVVVSGEGGRLITGQNPASATGVGEKVYEAIFGEEMT